jgi:hypothetical protein
VTEQQAVVQMQTVTYTAHNVEIVMIRKIMLILVHQRLVMAWTMIVMER